MCGFTVSIINPKTSTKANIVPKVNRSLRNIAHRGPDASNVITTGAVTLGHCRLSIIDLSERSNQPLSSENGRYHIVFNGEIYNYKDIKLDLDNWSFKTSSDTEVLLAAYDKWGGECFSRFVGQFAVCIFDTQKHQLIISRDMMGEKPLYMHTNEHGIFYSSEIRGLLPFLTDTPQINFSAFNDYLHYQYVPEPHSIIENIHKVEAGSVTFFDLNTMTNRTEYFWSWHAPQINSTEVTISEIEIQLASSINYSLVADVPIALGLSAGLDSAAIALFAKEFGTELSTYTIGYSGKPTFDERDGAQQLAKHLGLKNTQVEINPDDFIENFDEFCNALSEPIADTAGYGHYLVAKTIAEHDHKVMLSGIGGDEIFWGYEWTRLAVQFEEIMRFSAPQTIVNFFRYTPRVLKLIFMLSRSGKVPEKSRPFFRLLYTWLVSTTPKNQSMFMGISGAPEFTSQLNTGNDFYTDIECTGTPQCVYRHTKDIRTADTSEAVIINVLSKLNRTWLMSNSIQLADTLSMSNSIESRSPFLNPNLIKVLLAYNSKYRADKLGSKAVLRQIMENKLPQELLNRPKSGFVTPVAKWVNLLEEKYASLVNNGKLVEQGLIKRDFFSIYDPRNVTLNTKYRLILLENWYANLTNKYS